MLPLTLPALLAAAEPLLPLEAFPICSTIGPTCSRTERRGETFDGLPTGVQQLRELFGKINGWKPSIDQCPTCHRLYQYESGYEHLVDGSDPEGLARIVADDLPLDLAARARDYAAFAAELTSEPR